MRDRINSVKNTQKITDAMKLVAAAKVRRAQDAVINGRPFSENLVKVSLSLSYAPSHETVGMAMYVPFHTMLLPLNARSRM